MSELACIPVYGHVDAQYIFAFSFWFNMIEKRQYVTVLFVSYGESNVMGKMIHMTLNLLDSLNFGIYEFNNHV